MDYLFSDEELMGESERANSEDLPAITNDFLFHHLQEIVCYRWEVFTSLALFFLLSLSLGFLFPSLRFVHNSYS